MDHGSGYPLATLDRGGAVSVAAAAAGASSRRGIALALCALLSLAACADDDTIDLPESDAALSPAELPAATLMVQIDGGARLRMTLRSSAPGPGAAAHTWGAGRYFALVTVNGRVTSAAGRGLTLTGTQFTDPDPLLTPLSIPNGGASYRRAVDLTDGDDRRFGVPLACRIVPQGAQQIAILQTSHQVVRFRETCRGGGISAENYFWADVQTGFIWRAEQWAGDGVVTTEVAKPPSQ